MKHLNLIVLLALLMAFTFSCDAPTATDPENPDTLSEREIFIDEVQEFNETLSAREEASRLVNRPASDFTPSGFYLPPGTDLVVKLEQLEQGSGSPVLLIGTYSRYEAKWTPTEVQLHNGINTIAGDEHGGLLYIRYNADGNSVPSGRVRIEFMSGYKPVPYFVLGETTNEQWQTMLDTWTEAPDVQLVSDGAIIVASRENALKYRDDDQNQLLTLVEEVLKAQADISGLDGSAPEHQRNVHRILMTESDRESMAAADYRTYYRSDAVNRILTTDGFINEGWGPWHELGHMHQQWAWNWKGVWEVNNNIYTLAAERAMGISPSTLVTRGIWYDVADYLKLPDEERDFNSSAVGLYVRLAMFQQLWLAYGDEFFQELHKDTREDKPSSIGVREERMPYLMLKACEISGNDLGGFFRKWGFKVSASVYDEISALNLTEPDVDLTTLTDDPDWDRKWMVVDYSSQEPSGNKGRVFMITDGDPATFWHSTWSSDPPPEFPHHVTIDMKEPATVNGFTLTQRRGKRKVKDIEIQISNDNQNWESLGDYVLQDTTTPQNIDLAESRSFRYFKLIMKSAHDGEQFAAMAEVTVY